MLIIYYIHIWLILYKINEGGRAINKGEQHLHRWGGGHKGLMAVGGVGAHAEITSVMVMVAGE